MPNVERAALVGHRRPLRNYGSLAADAGVRRRFAPHQLRHAHAVELAREGVAVNIIQRQLGHTDLGTTSTYLQGIDPSEIIDTVRSRQPPTNHLDDRRALPVAILGTAASPACRRDAAVPYSRSRTSTSLSSAESKSPRFAGGRRSRQTPPTIAAPSDPRRIMTPRPGHAHAVQLNTTLDLRDKRARLAGTTLGARGPAANRVG